MSDPHSSVMSTIQGATSLFSGPGSDSSMFKGAPTRKDPGIQMDKGIGIASILTTSAPKGPGGME